jgi:hypothetical protein
MLTFAVVLRSQSDAHIAELIEHFSWEILTALLAVPICLNYVKNWLRSERSNDDEEMMEGVSSMTADFFVDVRHHRF